VSGDPRREPALRVEQIESLEAELRERLDGSAVARFNVEPEELQRSVAQLVLSLVDFVRQLMERQAIARMERGTLSDAEVERLGRALMLLEQTLHEIAARFGLKPEELRLDLGPLGRST
jgi:hypothetical protein